MLLQQQCSSCQRSVTISISIKRRGTALVCVRGGAKHEDISSTEVDHGSSRETCCWMRTNEYMYINSSSACFRLYLQCGNVQGSARICTCGLVPIGWLTTLVQYHAEYHFAKRHITLQHAAWHDTFFTCMPACAHMKAYTFQKVRTSRELQQYCCLSK